jgi:hypothetical protein
MRDGAKGYRAHLLLPASIWRPTRSVGRPDHPLRTDRRGTGDRVRCASRRREPRMNHRSRRGPRLAEIRSDLQLAVAHSVNGRGHAGRATVAACRRNEDRASSCTVNWLRYCTSRASRREHRRAGVLVDPRGVLPRSRSARRGLGAAAVTRAAPPPGWSDGASWSGVGVVVNLP